MQSLTTYIKNPELLNAEVVEELWQLVDRHPTYQAASLLLVRGLYQLQDQRFAETLRKVALQVPDREKLFDGNSWTTITLPGGASATLLLRLHGDQLFLRSRAQHGDRAKKE